MRLLISGGGTAGHVYPALAMLQAWPSPGPEVCWVGTPDGMEHEIVAEQRLAFVGVRAGAIRGRSLVGLLRSSALLCLGFAQALSVLGRFRPDVVLTTGGYVSIPVALAAWVRRIPVIVFLPDVRPGFAVRAQQRLATRIACAFEPAAALLPPARTVVTGYPVRPGFWQLDPKTARARLGLGEDLPVLLLYGGSRGARTLNDAVSASLPELLARCQFVHVSGALDHERLAQRAVDLPHAQRRRYHLHAFLGDQLVTAFAAADLCIARAGASTLAELPAAGLPAVVVPGDFSDQAANAAYLADHGAATVLRNCDVRDGRLVPVVLGLLEDDERRHAMAGASASLARPDAAEALVAELTALA